MKTTRYAVKTIIAYALFGIVSIGFINAQAPQKISYQAVIRGANNQLVSNTNIGFQVSILQGGEQGTAIYVERHFPTTNENGLVSVEIGTGTVISGSFESINWGDGDYYVKTETDLQGGANYTLSHTSQFLSVPYALFAAEGISAGTLLWHDNNNQVITMANVGIGTDTPASQLHVEGIGTGEGNVLFVGEYKPEPGNIPASGPGTRLMWYPDKVAFRAGRVNESQWDMANVGVNSVAMGINTMASGINSIAFGPDATASGASAFAWGYNSEASGNHSVVIGNGSLASSSPSYALGNSVTASGPSAVAIGLSTTSSGSASTATGFNTIASGSFATAMGRNARAVGDNSFAVNLDNATGPDVGVSNFRISGAASIGGNTAWTNYSDKRLKKDIQSLEADNNLEKIMKMNSVRFRRTDYDEWLNLGFIAQEMLGIVPESVRYDTDNDIYMMEYTAIIPVLVESIKEQQKMIDQLMLEVKSLHKEIHKISEGSVIK